jgi:DNA-binding transcriptional ArsR family regulator
MSFGARPASASLVPGDPVPDTLTVSLPTLADHTRLRILKLLRERALTQTEIAKKLRLRTPTISHHMKTLRAAGLLRFEKTDQEQIRFALRQSRVREVCHAIREFLSIED